MLTGISPVMKAAPRGAVVALGLGRVAGALGACLSPDMAPAGAGAGPMGGLGVREEWLQAFGKREPHACLAVHSQFIGRPNL